MSTESQINANRRNARASTGPRTPEGKAASSANSTRHGLSGCFRVLDNDNWEEFDELIAEYHRTFKPANTHEQFLVEEMAQSRWRLACVRRLEAEFIEDMVAHRGFANPDAMMAGALRNDTASAFTTLQRYAASIRRAAFRALDQLLALRKLETRSARERARQNEANSRTSASDSAGCPPPNGAPGHPPAAPAPFQPPVLPVPNGLAT
ncbi:MAG: hypothetical protein ABSF98_05280 [Bryobacteraceae bacterium]